MVHEASACSQAKRPKESELALCVHELVKCWCQSTSKITCTGSVSAQGGDSFPRKKGMHVGIYICIYMYVFVCMYIYIDVCMCMYLGIYIYICMSACIYIYMYAYIYVSDV